MKISIITLFPEMFTGVFGSSIIKRAQEYNHVTINFFNLKDFGIGKHKIVDDTPYGGGVGMVLKVDVLDTAIQEAKNSQKSLLSQKVILLDPKGRQYTQKIAQNLTSFDHLILICGHYEGYDERVRELVDDEISIGDFVMSGGELPAMVLTESIIRLIPGVLQKDEAHRFESFSDEKKGLLEHAQYTRPAVYKDMEVPEVLLSGNFAKIDEFRAKSAHQTTRKRRPDLLKGEESELS
ncbi:MAG TPA: tRNA (guanosine(37)-N1)-methyltransferase TrmD [Candidatus Levybacteria bacterium]|nr:tRNA (guanosine(37)-N1)-methyltransferase TrmD [Candidatus Levybacteria bacterium]